ncbi:CBS domain-containing protein [Bdellovibrio svalbardensis]|uniref:CBS domain-containing protein n=1 Tax=Bdellovibrio svalbardensis TaxID=2972972 RepID=A0ABT6DFY3_9BACT|nr:CBS domain-containing protein [Bdellovibrio svalbardensis]MDG0815760.1 CBS domain-containing protein [Bdellovibrio svalbardensis]
MRVKEVMRPRAEVIHFDHTVAEAAKMMLKGDYGCIPVERADKMVGMLTDRDIVVRVVAKGLDPAKTTVEECMSEGINYCFDDDDIAVVGQTMISKKIRRMPVINRSKRLVGMLSLGDIANRAQNRNLSHDILSHVSH